MCVERAGGEHAAKCVFCSTRGARCVAHRISEDLPHPDGPRITTPIPSLTVKRKFLASWRLPSGVE